MAAALELPAGRPQPHARAHARSRGHTPMHGTAREPNTLWGWVGVLATYHSHPPTTPCCIFAGAGFCVLPSMPSATSTMVGWGGSTPTSLLTVLTTSSTPSLQPYPCMCINAHFCVCVSAPLPLFLCCRKMLFFANFCGRSRCLSTSTKFLPCVSRFFLTIGRDILGTSCSLPFQVLTSLKCCLPHFFFSRFFLQSSASIRKHGTLGRRHRTSRWTLPASQWSRLHLPRFWSLSRVVTYSTAGNNV